MPAWTHCNWQNCHRANIGEECRMPEMKVASAANKYLIHEQTYPPASIILIVQKWFWAVLALEVLAIVFFQIPIRLGFDGTAFGDYGLSLNAQFLIQHGYRPGVDFGYPYGPLSLLFGQLWFNLFGLTPHAFFSAMTICDLVFAVGLAQFAASMKFRWPALALIAVCVPFSILMDITVAHALERVLMVWALAAQADGRRSHALALATGAALVKPSMGFVYGFLLLVFIVAALWEKSELTARFLAREIQPAVFASSRNREEPTPAREITLFCAVLHLAFITLFFGNNSSWTSYPYLLAMGVGAMTLWSKYSEKLVWLLIILGVVGQKGMIAQNLHAWFNTAPSTAT